MCQKNRCAWASSEPNITYHDTEWGVPVHDDQALFEKLILDGMQAGLSWEIILKKREGIRQAFDYFDIEKILRYDEAKILELMQDSRIIRNRRKIEAVIANARAYKELRHTHGSLDQFLWEYVGGIPIKNSWKALSEVPTSTELSDRISRDLKKLGFKFVGSTIVYAYIQAVGLVNDHLTDCFRREQV